MREIKFRAWDGEKMVVVNDIVLSGEKAKAFWKENSVYEWSEIIMQFTGLKDKNGKEIYEGDILTGHTSYEMSNDERGWTKEKPCVVEWYEECAGFNPFLLNARWRCDVENIEVIGNIYENPDLLNSDKNDERSVATEADSSNEAGIKKENP